MLLKIYEYLRKVHAEGSLKATATTMLLAFPCFLLVRSLANLDGSFEVFMFDMLIYIVLYVGFDHLLSTRQERTNRMHGLKEGVKYLYQEHRYTCLHLCCIFGLLIFFATVDSEPENPSVLSVYNYFNVMIDVIAIFYFLFIVTRLALRVAQGETNVIEYLYQAKVDMLTMITVMIGISALIGTQGDEAYAYYLENTEEAVGYLVTLAMLGIAVMMKNLIGNPMRYRVGSCQESGHMMAVAKPAKAKEKYQMSAKSMEQTAYHEAGHALFFACLKPYPHNMKMVVRGDYDDTRLGYVTGLGEFEMSPTKSMMEWSMMRYLAGDRATVLFTGDSVSGAGSDHQKWLVRAEQYLEEQYRGTYYAKPKTILEQQANNLLLNQLRDDQIRIVDAFLAANEVVIHDMVGEVLSCDDMKLDRKALAPFMDRVELTSAIPLIKN